MGKVTENIKIRIAPSLTLPKGKENHFGKNK